MHCHRFLPRPTTRREMLLQTGSGFGAAALTALMADPAFAGPADSRRNDPLAPRKPHLSDAPAKSCIFVYLAGAPSQLELFNYKPKLVEYNGQKLPDPLTEGVRFAFINKNATVMSSTRKFAQHGQSGMWFSDALPHLASCADDICMIHSMHTEAFNHHPGQLLMCCGLQRFGRPSIGSWLTYGLGSESENLPGYVVLTAGAAARGGATLYTNGFLPSSYGGVLFRSQGEPVLNLDNPPGLPREVQRKSLDALADLNRERLQAFDPRKSRIIELRCFGGLTIDECARLMGLSAPTIVNETRLARAWLHREIRGGRGGRRLLGRGCRGCRPAHRGVLAAACPGPARAQPQVGRGGHTGADRDHPGRGRGRLATGGRHRRREGFAQRGGQSSSTVGRSRSRPAVGAGH